MTASLGISFPVACSNSSLEQLLSDIEAMRICEGVTDSSLLAVVNEQTHKAFLDDLPTLDQNNVVHFRTARDVNCTLLVSGMMIRCQKCANLIKQLRSKVYQESTHVTMSSSKFTPNVHLSTPQKLSKLAGLAMDRATSKKIASLEIRIKAMYANSSVAVDPALDTDLGPIMTGSNATEAFIKKAAFRS